MKFLRTELRLAAVARPAIDIETSFTAAARAAGVVGPNETFDPYADETSFLLGAYIFEDVGVTAYKGAAPLLKNKTFLEAAAGILAAEAYHAANIRTTLFALGLAVPTVQISDARDSLDGPDDLDQGIADTSGAGNIVSIDENGLAPQRRAGARHRVSDASGENGGRFLPARRQRRDPYERRQRRLILRAGRVIVRVSGPAGIIRQAFLCVASRRRCRQPHARPPCHEKLRNL